MSATGQTTCNSSAVRQQCPLVTGRYSLRYAASHERVQMACC